MTATKVLLLIFIIKLLIFPSIASITEQRFPTLWFEAPSSISDYPLVSNCSSSETMNDSGCRLIDPWSYLDRLGLYKILINATTPYMTFCSVSLFHECNILFGLAAHLGWQFDSNRLFSNGTKQISVNSWWASFNYYLSVIPFLAAIDTGIIHPGSFQIVQRDIFCSNSTQCFIQIPEAMIQWRLFFTNITHLSDCYVSSIDNVIDECFLGPMWLAHNASIENALPIIEPKISLLPSLKEQRFGLAWTNVISYIGMTRKNSNIIETNMYQDRYLPERILREEDNPPFCPDLSESVNKALELLLDVPIEFYSEFRPEWYEATFCYESRRMAQIAIEMVPLSKTIAYMYYELALISVLTC